MWTDREICAWLDELLPAERMSEFENQLRTDKVLQSRIAQMIRHRDQGGHSIGEIWQRERLSCPTRTELGGFLLGTLGKAESDYIEFHTMTVGCRICQANLNDLEEHVLQSNEAPARRRKFFESSAGLLNPSEDQDF